ncbi:hypothetical protein YTPLAS73_09550 [Nitrosarchaeum sp.]|nr:hypothetical protein YTPLAS73_09550 [Nitrosarchaeum sp.]
MEILGDFAFLSKCTLNMNIQNGAISINIVDIKEEDFEEIKRSFDKLKLMNPYKFGVTFEKVTLLNLSLSKDIYTKNCHGYITLKPDS